MFKNLYIGLMCLTSAVLLTACGGDEESSSGYGQDNAQDESSIAYKDNLYLFEGNDIEIYWNFDDDEITRDLAYSHVTVQGVSLSEGVSGNSFYFDGTAKVEWSLPEQRRLDEFTLAFWVKSEGLQQESYASVFANDSLGVDFQIDTNGENPGSYQFRGEERESFYELDSDWLHLAVVKEMENIKFYVDGLLVKEIAPQGIYFQTFRIGRNRTDTKGFIGWVDEFLFVNKVLDEDDINTLASLSGSYDRPNNSSPGDTQNPDDQEPVEEPIEQPIEEPSVNYAKLFNDDVVQSSCISCHKSGGIAGSTPLIFEEGNTTNIADNNYSVLSNYLSQDAGNQQRLRNKVLGLTAHGGGKVLDENSTALETLDTVLEELAE